MKQQFQPGDIVRNNKADYLDEVKSQSGKFLALASGKVKPAYKFELVHRPSDCSNWQKRFEALKALVIDIPFPPNVLRAHLPTIKEAEQAERIAELEDENARLQQRFDREIAFDDRWLREKHNRMLDAEEQLSTLQKQIEEVVAHMQEMAEASRSDAISNPSQRERFSGMAEAFDYAAEFLQRTFPPQQKTAEEEPRFYVEKQEWDIAYDFAVLDRTAETRSLFLNDKELAIAIAELLNDLDNKSEESE